MNFENTKKLLNEKGQIQLLEYYDGLDEDKRAVLLNDISKINFSVIDCINQHDSDKNLEKIAPIPAKSLEEIEKNRKKYREEGIKLLRAGKVGAVILAGGQGTRLGFDKPKGMFNIGVNRNLSIFVQLFNNIKEVTD